MQRIRNWANVNINKTFVDQSDPRLNGQCVALVKCFLAECCDCIPNPYGSRGNAKDYGENLVEQGLATYATEPQAGDILVWTGGAYGHIALYLGSGVLFEENSNLTPATLAPNGTYTSRIGLYRTPDKIYRLKPQYYNNEKKKGTIMRTLFNDGSGAIGWFTPTHWGYYSDPDELQVDINTGQATYPCIDWTNRSAPWDLRMKRTRIMVS
jgi:hypothetical protein